MNPLAASFDCQDYKELETVDEAFDLWKAGIPAEWAFQLKYDGIWAKIVVENGRAIVYSKTGQVKHSFACDGLFNRQTCVLLGEYMFGSQWSQHPDRKGLIFVFDCLAMDGNDVSTLPWRRRLELAEALTLEVGGPLRKTNAYSVSKLGEVWSMLERVMSHEGLVVRNRNSTYFSPVYKLKTRIEDDFVCLGMYEGEGKHAGRLGGITVGKWRGNELVEIMRVGGGFSDAQREFYWHHGKEIISHVVLVEGKSRFESGALRHPNFIRVRDDKLSQECKIEPT